MVYPIPSIPVIYGDKAKNFFETLKEYESKFANKSEILKMISIYNHEKDKISNFPF